MIFFLFALKRNEKFEAKRSEHKRKKLFLYFRLKKRKQSETDPVSLRFASKRNKFLSETSAPYTAGGAVSLVLGPMGENGQHLL
jgi:hypothetical protein